MNITELILNFEKVFNIKEDKKLFFSPGRVNLIGEHIDYNGGCVFPAAITFGTYAVVTERSDDKVCLYSGNFKEQGMIQFALSDLSNTGKDHWSIYVKGVLDQFIKAGYKIKSGFNAYIEGNIPNSSGLSSSASLELLISQIISELNQLDISMIDKVKLSQKAENENVGVQCGIMDQFAIGMGKKDYAIKLNTDSLDYEYALADLKEYAILIMNTNAKRELADSKYNERRSECEQALALLKTKIDIENLCDLSVSDFNKISSVLTEDLLYRRAKHTITENERVGLAIKALEHGHLEKFGELLNQSHISLRDDYEVTGKELDTIVELAWKQQGIIGARMTGAGFGGCAIALVHKDYIDQSKANISKEYKQIIGYDAEFYVATIGDGTRTLDKPE